MINHTPTRVTAAVCTMMCSDASLHEDAMRRHLSEQWDTGAGVLVAGSMGLMQQLPDGTYEALVRCAASVRRGGGELLVGIGDSAYHRTLERLRFACSHDIDGVVVLTPYLFPFEQHELVDYFRALADVSPKPVYLYNLPQATGCPLSMQTVLAVCDHPQIRGIKCSGDLARSWRVHEAIGHKVRVILAQPTATDLLLRLGVPDILDGIYAVLPVTTARLCSAAREQDWAAVRQMQSEINALLDAASGPHGVLAALGAFLNARGIDGQCHVAPTRPLTEEQRERWLNLPAVRCLLDRETGGRERQASSGTVPASPTPHR